MSVDIRDLLDDAAAEQAPRPDYDELWGRGRRRARLRTGAVAFAALSVLGLAGAVLAETIDDRAPQIVDQPDGGDGPAPSEADREPIEHEIDLTEVFGSADTSATFDRVAVFAEGSGPATIGRDEKGVGPSNLSAFGSCATAAAECEFGLVDAANDRVVVRRTDGEVGTLDLEQYGYRAPGSLLVRELRDAPIVFVTVARDVAGAGISRLLAIDVGTGDLLADVEHPSPVSNPTIELGRAPGDEPDAALRVWVQVNPERTYVPVLVETRVPATNAVAFESVTDGTSVPMPISSATGVAVDVATNGQRARVTVTGPGRDRAWSLAAALVDAVHPTHDGVLVVVRPWGESQVRHLVRIVEDRIVEHRPAPRGAVGGDLLADGTLLTVLDAADGGIEVIAQRPSSYAGTDPFTMGGRPATALRLVDGLGWVLNECYVSPIDEGTLGICVGQSSVQDGSRLALFEAPLAVDGRPSMDGVTFLADLPGSDAADLIGARWAEVGGPLVHLGVAADGTLFIYELDTGRLRPAVEGEFDQHR